MSQYGNSTEQLEICQSILQHKSSEYDDTFYLKIATKIVELQAIQIIYLKEKLGIKVYEYEREFIRSLDVK